MSDGWVRQKSWYPHLDNPEHCRRMRDFVFHRLEVMDAKIELDWDQPEATANRLLGLLVQYRPELTGALPVILYSDYSRSMSPILGIYHPSLPEVQVYEQVPVEAAIPRDYEPRRPPLGAPAPLAQIAIDHLTDVLSGAMEGDPYALMQAYMERFAEEKRTESLVEDAQRLGETHDALMAEVFRRAEQVAADRWSD